MNDDEPQPVNLLFSTMGEIRVWLTYRHPDLKDYQVKAIAESISIAAEYTKTTDF